MSWKDYEKDFNDLVQDYVKKNLPFPEDKMRLIGRMLDDEDARRHLKGVEYFDAAMGQGDFFDFERVHPVLRNYLAIKKSEVLFGSSVNLDCFANGNTRNHRDVLEENAMNPAFRLYCSLRAARFQADEAQAPTGRNNVFREYDDYMNSFIMRQTLAPVTGERFLRLEASGLKGSKLNEALAQNVEKQVQMAKILFLAHYGRPVLMTEEHGVRVERQLDRTVASMMAHCSRTAFVFPKGSRKQTDDMMESVTGPDMGSGAGIYRRTAATHSSSNGAAFEEYQEKKGVSFSNQYGMDVAVGGLGEEGIPGSNGRQILKNDGTCGHMYMRMDKGSANQTSSILLGFESDSPSASGNQQGHRHTVTAAPEYMSSFLGQRTDEMGLKYGGRLVDLTGLDPDKVTETMNEFTNRYRVLVVAAMTDPGMAERLRTVNESLTEKPMDAHHLALTLSELGFSTDACMDIARDSASLRGNSNPGLSRGDYMQRISPRPVPPARPKPGLFIRFQAFLGISAAKTAVGEYNAYREYSERLADDVRSAAQRECQTRRQLDRHSDPRIRAEMRGNAMTVDQLANQVASANPEASRRTVIPPNRTAGTQVQRGPADETGNARTPGRGMS